MKRDVDDFIINRSLRYDMPLMNLYQIICLRRKVCYVVTQLMSIYNINLLEVNLNTVTQTYNF